MNFTPHPSFEVPRQPNGLVSKSELSDFWADLDKNLGHSVSEGIGCYIFSVKAGRGALPWYVGLAEKQSFRKECFTPHKLNHYNNSIAGRKGIPILTLIGKYTPGNKLILPTGAEHRDIQFLELLLIANAMSKNGALLNIKDTKLLREMVVPGLLNSSQGKPTTAVVELKAILGI